MTKRAATAAVAVVLLTLTGCGPAQPVSSPPSTLSEALPNEDTFTFPVTDENAPPGTISKATYAGNTLNLEYFDSDKLGTFTR